MMVFKWSGILCLYRGTETTMHGGFAEQVDTGRIAMDGTTRDDDGDDGDLDFDDDFDECQNHNGRWNW
jgi:hypothetical protein